MTIVDDLRTARERGVRPSAPEASLHEADLRGASLHGASLREADLREADLREANLHGADWGGLALEGMPSGSMRLTPTVDGWRLSVGCWAGSVDGLEALIAGTDWPEADEEQQVVRRPGLAALVTLCRAHIDANPDVIPALVERWGSADPKEA